MKPFSMCAYTLSKEGLINPRFKGIAGWPEPETLVRRFTGNLRQRRKKHQKFIRQALDAYYGRRSG